MRKTGGFSIVEPLCKIFEESFEKGIYPSTLKKANIVTVHKKGSRWFKNNYRSISLLQILGKIFEKLLFDKTYSHLCANGLLTPVKSGFRPGDSTINQLLSITHKIYSAFEEIPSKETWSAFLDCRRHWTGSGMWAYFTNFNAIITGNLLSLIQIYSANRKQRVVLETVLNGQQYPIGCHKGQY